jgi:hypothetical protein
VSVLPGSAAKAIELTKEATAKATIFFMNNSLLRWSILKPFNLHRSLLSFFPGNVL